MDDDDDDDGIDIEELPQMLDTIVREMIDDDDGLRQNAKFQDWFLEEADEATKEVIDKVLRMICGWSFATLMTKAKEALTEAAKAEAAKALEVESEARTRHLEATMAFFARLKVTTDDELRRLEQESREADRAYRAAMVFTRDDHARHYGAKKD
jgi:hypothetical protein